MMRRQYREGRCGRAARWQVWALGAALALGIVWGTKVGDLRGNQQQAGIVWGDRAQAGLVWGG